jgi:iron complex outermembrane receptor protein
MVHQPSGGAQGMASDIKSVRETEADDNKLNTRLYTDVQLRFFAPSFADNYGFALGVNNLFDKDPPGCISCGLNNFDPTTYDVPGRYFYARATIRL